MNGVKSLIKYAVYVYGRKDRAISIQSSWPMMRKDIHVVSPHHQPHNVFFISISSMHLLFRPFLSMLLNNASHLIWVIERIIHKAIIS